MVLAGYALAALMAGAYLGKDRLARTLLWVTVAAFLVVAAMVGLGNHVDGAAFHGMFIDDGFSRFAKVVTLVAAAGVLAMSADYMQRRNMLRFEFPIIVALAVLGMMFMVSAGDLLTLYMGLELQSLALYVVAAMRRDSVRSSEAGLKYFVLGSLSSGLLLYGASLVYGFAGTTGFEGIISTIEPATCPWACCSAWCSCWWACRSRFRPCPSTCGRPTSTRLADAGHRLLRHRAQGRGHGADRAAGLRRLRPCHRRLEPDRRGAGGDVDVPGLDRRDRPDQHQAADGLFLDRAYGFALVGLAAGTAIGVQNMLLYMTIYAVMNIGTFAFILSMERDACR